MANQTENRIAAAATLARVVAGELREMAKMLPEFASSPTGYPISGRLITLSRACATAHLVSGHVGLREMADLALYIESRFEHEDRYEELIAQVKVLAGVLRETVLQLRRFASAERSYPGPLAACILDARRVRGDIPASDAKEAVREEQPRERADEIKEIDLLFAAYPWAEAAIGRDLPQTVDMAVADARLREALQLVNAIAAGDVAQSGLRALRDRLLAAEARNPVPSWAAFIETAISLVGALDSCLSSKERPQEEFAGAIADIATELSRVVRVGIAGAGFPKPETMSRLIGAMLAVRRFGGQRMDVLFRKYEVESSGGTARNAERALATWLEQFESHWAKAAEAERIEVVTDATVKLAEAATKINSRFFREVATLLRDCVAQAAAGEDVPKVWIGGAVAIAALRLAIAHPSEFDSEMHGDFADKIMGVFYGKRLRIELEVLTRKVRTDAARRMWTAVMDMLAGIEKDAADVMRKLDQSSVLTEERVAGFMQAKCAGSLETVAGIMRFNVAPHAASLVAFASELVADPETWGSRDKLAKLVNAVAALSLFAGRMNSGGFAMIGRDIAENEMPAGWSPATGADVEELAKLRVRIDRPQDAALLAVFAEEADLLVESAFEILRGDLSRFYDLPEGEFAEAPAAVVRRAFHTLKGSGRIAGLTIVGDVAEVLQVAMDTAMAARQPATEVVEIAAQALRSMSAWIKRAAAVSPPELKVDVEEIEFVESLVGDIDVEVDFSAEGAAMALGAEDAYIDQTIAEIGQRVASAGAKASEPDVDAVAADARRSPNVVSGVAADSASRAPETSIAGLVEQVLEPVPPVPSVTPVASEASLPVTSDDRDGDPGSFAANAAREESVDDQALLKRFIAAADGVQDHQVNLSSAVASSAIAEIDAICDEASASADLLGERSIAEDGAGALEAGRALRHHVHTLKGVLRLVGAARPASILHAMEEELQHERPAAEVTQLARAYTGAMAAVRSMVESLIVDLQERFDPLRHQAAEAGRTDVTATTPADVSSAEPGRIEPPAPATDAHGGQTAPAFAEHPGHPAAVDQPRSDAQPAAAAEPPASSAQPVKAAEAPPARPQLAAAAAAGRRPADAWGAVSRGAGEAAVLGRKSADELRRGARAMRDLSSATSRLGEAIRELSLQADMRIEASRRLDPQRMDPLELDRFDRLQEIVRSVAEHVADVRACEVSISSVLGALTEIEERQQGVLDLINDEARGMMVVSLAANFSRLRRTVEVARQGSGKQCQLVIEQDAELPAPLMTTLIPVIEHLLRNCVAHGIELPDHRVGKPEVGHIAISAQVAGTQVIVKVRDDGSGIRVGRVGSKAIEKGLIAADQQISRQQLIDLIFEPGFSTAEKVDQVAGRGVGLDVVRSAMLRLGGDVTVDTEEGAGTEFTLTAPSDVSSMSVIPVRSGGTGGAGYEFMLPASVVREIRTLTREEADRAAGGGLEIAPGRVIRYVRAHDLMGVAASASRSVMARVQVVVCGREDGDADGAIAIEVDELDTYRRVVLRLLSRRVTGVSGVIAAAVASSGKAVAVVNPMRIRQRKLSSQDAGFKQASAAKMVLVVDDSSTVRLVATEFLTANGYAAVEARDGAEALAMLAQGLLPSVILLDVDMPRVNGFQVASAVRSDANPSIATLPIIMCTSRTAERHVEIAKTIGVDRYIGKPFEPAQLLGAIEDVLQRTAPGAQIAEELAAVAAD